MTQQELKEYLHYNPETGIFIWLQALSSRGQIGSIAGYQQTRGDIVIKINKVGYRAHRLAFIYMGECLPEQVDHINHIPSDNRWSNLRAANSAINGKNHPKTKRNTSGCVGVSQRKDGYWVARIYVGKKRIYLGASKYKETAIQLRKEALIKYDFHPNHGL